MKIKQLYAGFDTIEVAFLGALPIEVLEVFREAKQEAAKQQERQLVTIGPGNVAGHIASHGLTGGYAFLFDTGPTGDIWNFKDTADPSKWNIAVKPHASALACYSYQETKERFLHTLKDMGCRFGIESIRRVDFAMDFLMPETFELNHMQFVTHHRSKVKPYFDPKEEPDPNTPSLVFQGRRIGAVTVGKMPGRQAIVYNKRKAAIEQRTYYWFKVWEIDPKDTTKNIWRVELRAGKKELKDKWNIRTFTDLENSIGDVFNDAVEKVRYLDDFQTDGNVTRQRMHPLWLSAMECLSKKLTDYRSGLVPGQVREVFREQQAETYMQQITGNAAGLAVVLELEEEEIRETLGRDIGQTISNIINTPDTRFFESRDRAQNRLIFKTQHQTGNRVKSDIPPRKAHPKPIPGRERVRL
ncbi:hypothetical protein [Sneathiella sp. HT1-7]|uniref:hypothetical protein n=1 Tax=Sneathiella sp. HT1-7 TaxID=2887192 RepID=UPI001D15324C|nr:hypothetical protein [Sneathiella sp. HT1-7]MCC3306604.1 hypothetical protein [Sneathiella sp. HT1-7]